MCPRARSFATSPAAASRTGSTGTSGPRLRLRLLACRATPARPTTCPRADRHWLPDSLKSLHADVQTGVQELFESELAIHTGDPRSSTCRPIRTSADFVDLVAETSPHDLLDALFTDDYHDDDLNQLLSRAIDGDQSAAKELSGKLPEWQKKGRLALVNGRRRHASADPRGAPGLAGQVQRDRAAGRGDPRARLRRASRGTRPRSDRPT